MGPINNVRKVFQGEKTHDPKHADVLVTLEDATRHEKVLKAYARQQNRSRGSESEERDKDIEDGGVRSESGRHSPNSIEGLREECTEGVEGETAYDCEFFFL